jgi:hypothetical protein
MLTRAAKLSSTSCPAVDYALAYGHHDKLRQIKQDAEDRDRRFHPQQIADNKQCRAALHEREGEAIADETREILHFRGHHGDYRTGLGVLPPVMHMVASCAWLSRLENCDT